MTELEMYKFIQEYAEITNIVYSEDKTKIYEYNVCIDCSDLPELYKLLCGDNNKCGYLSEEGVDCKWFGKYIGIDLEPLFEYEDINGLNMQKENEN